MREDLRLLSPLWHLAVIKTTFFQSYNAMTDSKFAQHLLQHLHSLPFLTIIRSEVSNFLALAKASR